jgi:two-component system, chemotaxis family, chemotaxis protein CheY
VNEERRLRILISDDDAIGRLILQRMLEPYGDCVCTITSDEAVSAYRAACEKREPFDVVFLDVMMPGKEGTVALREIRGLERSTNLGRPVPVIMLTGQTDTAVIVSAKEAGANHYMLKPVHTEAVLRELRRLGLIPDPDDQW